MRHIKRLLAAASMIGGLAANPAGAAVIFGDGAGNGASIDVSASVYVYGTTASGSSSESDYDVTPTTPSAPLFAEASATKDILRSVVQASATATETGTASFASPSSAQIIFSGSTSTASNVQLGAAGAYDDTSNFTYNFSTTKDAVLTLDYSLSGVTSDYYNGSGYLQDITAADFPVYFEDFTPESNVFTADLIAGHSYLFAVTDIYHDLVQVAGIDSATGSREDIYNLSITSVPETATWAMMIIGFGMIGGLIRRTSRQTDAGLNANMGAIASA